MSAPSVADRFWAKVDGGHVDECWSWVAARSRHGYGVFWVGRPIGLARAHRWAWEHLRGEIPAGLVLDHLCRVRHCVNPWHLEPVTQQVNSKRGAWGIREKCPQGHPYSESNTEVRVKRSGFEGRECLTCRREFHELRRRANRAALDADPSLAPHGRLTTYNDWMCRCDECRAASAEYRRRWRASKARAA